MNANVNANRTVAAVVRSAVAALALVSGALVTGCLETETDAAPPVIIGDWESEETFCGENDWIEMDDDLTGEARIYFALDGECYFADFDVEVEEVDTDEYEIAFEVQDRELAFLLDFVMTCEVEDDDEIECEGSDGFGDAEWVFERD